MKFTQTLFTLAAAFGAAQASWNTTVAVTDVVTVPCTTSTGTAASATGYIPTSNGTTYSVPAIPTGTGAVTVPSGGVVTAGAASLDARVFVGAVAAVAAVAFTL